MWKICTRKPERNYSAIQLWVPFISSCFHVINQGFWKICQKLTVFCIWQRWLLLWVCLNIKQQWSFKGLLSSVIWTREKIKELQWFTVLGVILKDQTHTTVSYYYDHRISNTERELKIWCAVLSIFFEKFHSVWKYDRTVTCVRYMSLIKLKTNKRKEK